MLELTSLEELPLFINVMMIESLEQREEATLIITNSGASHYVQEHAADIMNEIAQYTEALYNNSNMN